MTTMPRTWYILPTLSLRDLVYRRLRQRYPELNYCCEWKDTKGWGLHLGTFLGFSLTGMYHVPPSARHYKVDTQAHLLRRAVACFFALPAVCGARERWKQAYRIARKA